MIEGLKALNIVKERTTIHYKYDKKEKTEDFCSNYIILASNKVEYLIHISHMNIHPTQKIFLMFLIIISYTKESEKPYFGQTIDITQRVHGYRAKLRALKTGKLLNQLKVFTSSENSSAILLGFRDSSLSQNQSKILETIFIRFVGIEHTLNQLETMISRNLITKLPKNLKLPCLFLYTICANVCTIMTNHTLYEKMLKLI